MFDIGFFELLLILIVGLVVIGPERLPQVARTTGLWVGRFRQRFGEARNHFEDAIGADEVRRQLHNEAVMRKLGEEYNVPPQAASQSPESKPESHREKDESEDSPHPTENTTVKN